MEFHRAMVQLNDSQRINDAFELALAEMRLIFSLMEDSRHLHEPYISWNVRILEALEANDLPAAAKELELYLVKSQSDVLAALARTKAKSTGAGR
jgi:DNA-binding GntR family transcriptional regulator